MIANFGYSDGSGSYYITVDSDRCNGCGDCVRDCPTQILALVENPYDPLSEEQSVIVEEKCVNKIKYICSPCKPLDGWKSLPCTAACATGAITHSW